MVNRWRIVAQPAPQFLPVRRAKSHPEDAWSSWVCQSAGPEPGHCPAGETTALAGQEQDNAAWNLDGPLDAAYLGENPDCLTMGITNQWKGIQVPEAVLQLLKKTIKAEQPEIYC